MMRLSLLVFMLSILVYGLNEWHSAKPQQTVSITEEFTPDFVAESLRSDIYNKDGNLSYEIDAQRMEHYPELAFTIFELPNYTLYPDNNSAPWTVSALEATFYNDNRVTLESKVRLIATDKNSLIQEIHCKYLELDLNSNIVSSDQEIVILGKDFTTTGTGLIIDLNTTQMTLTKHVQTTYKKSNS
jgi:lipopolysaccharide export system protein LptC